MFTTKSPPPIQSLKMYLTVRFEEEQYCTDYHDSLITLSSIFQTELAILGKLKGVERERKSHFIALFDKGKTEIFKVSWITINEILIIMLYAFFESVIKYFSVRHCDANGSNSAANQRQTIGTGRFRVRNEILDRKLWLQYPTVTIHMTELTNSRESTAIYIALGTLQVQIISDPRDQRSIEIEQMRCQSHN